MLHTRYMYLTCFLCGHLQESELSELSGVSGDEGGSLQGSLQDPGNAVSMDVPI